MKFLLIIAVLFTTSCATTYRTSKLADAYLEMPQLLFEDLCLRHPKWTENEMATYYLSNQEMLDGYYANNTKVIFYDSVISIH